jgi:diketogulonate reductase-like aldo/keto reductase
LTCPDLSGTIDAMACEEGSLDGRRAFLRVSAGALGGMLMPNRSGASSLLERRMPKSGEALPAVGLGTWQAFDVGGDARGMAEAQDALRVLVELGGRVVDSSPMYGSAEAVTGQAAAELGVSSKLFLATKVWTSGKQAGIRQMEESRRRLRVQRLDLLQVHNLVDAETQIATLREWKAAGRIRYLGVTHYHAGAHTELEKVIARGDIDAVQVNYSLAEPEADRRLLRAAAHSGTAVIVNRPFAEGAMFSRVKGRAVPGWAKDAGCASWAQFFLKWILAQPAVTCVIPGTRNARHVADNVGAATGPLPDEAMRRRMAEHFNSL